MAKVSIIIPTCNRAHLLRFALKSAVEQDYRNIEIVVSDNYSIDNTEKIVKSFNSQNIVYIKTSKPLSMPDNWEFALAKASGEYVTCLTDDSYLLPYCISEALKDLDKFNLKVAVWKHCTYFDLNWLDPSRRNILYIPRVTSKSYLLNSRKKLEELFNDPGGVPTTIPRALNSLCHRSVIEKVMSIQDRFFLPPAPDYTSAASILLNTENYLLIDQPYFIDGVTTSSIGAVGAFNLGESVREFVKEFDNKSENITFLGIPTVISGIFSSLEEVRKFYSDVCPEINKKALLCKMIDQLTKAQSNSEGNVSDYWQKLNKCLSQQSAGMKLTFAKQRILSKLKWRLVKKIRNSSYLRYIEAPRNRLRNSYILKGEKGKFNNIEEAAEVVTSILKSNKVRK